MNLNRIKFYVVEDEPVNRAGMVKLLNKNEDTCTVGQADCVNDAFKGILETNPTALMLDIKLIGGDAFTLLQRLKDQRYPIPPVVIVTGHLDFELAQEALNNYRDHVVYILQKPFLENWKDKYVEICDAIRSYYLNPHVSTSNSEKIFILRSKQYTYRVPASEVEYIEVGGNGTIIIHTDFGKKIKVYDSLSNFILSAPSVIVRIHRKYAVHKEKIEYVDHEDRMLYLNGHKTGLDIGDNFYSDIVNMIK